MKNTYSFALTDIVFEMGMETDTIILHVGDITREVSMNEALSLKSAIEHVITRMVEEYYKDN